MKTLIADDNPVTRSILEQAVRAWGHEPTSGATGTAALYALEDPDGPRQPRYLILVTGRGGSADVVEGLEAGADNYVSKPFHPMELRPRVRAGERALQLQRELVERERFQRALEMAGAVCHEFNQPLQVIRGWTELLLDEAGCGDGTALRSIGVAVEAGA